MNGYKLGPVVQRQISAANPGFSSAPRSLFLLFKSIFQDNFLYSSLQIVDKKIKLFCFLSFISEFKFHPSLNNCKTLRTPHMWDCTWGGGGSQAIECYRLTAKGLKS